MLGRGGYRVFTIRAITKGKDTLDLVYARPWLFDGFKTGNFSKSD